jgi:hypothetical protein
MTWHFVTIYFIEWIYLYIDANGESKNVFIFTDFSNLTVTYYLNLQFLQYTAVVFYFVGMYLFYFDHNLSRVDKLVS